ncbi:hypothetical protein PROFUN_09916 [Planoprotostelium fungivorum]|uniref:MRH domain-containing protein n=1 Tax=Planoprotostelium fungivorum TaxID=1890364 RepID=A0A2P6NG95_9EUKA|nr:hypothetical protein PROFUN_09916 [Planoprotostelium fungivorum]
MTPIEVQWSNHTDTIALYLDPRADSAQHIDWALLCIFLSLFLVSEAVFDLSNRIGETKYTIEVFTAEQAKGKTFEGTVIPMTSVFRQKVNCYLPIEGKPPQEEHSSDEDKDAKRLIDTALPLGQCIYRLEGWWVYEFCPKKHLRQYHQEKGETIRPQDEFILGKFVKDSGREDAEHYKESYNLGTPCDITGLQRSTEVQYECSTNSANHISSIREPATCTYVVTISTPAICKHPQYKPKKDHVEVISYDALGMDSTKHVMSGSTGAESRLPKKAQGITGHGRQTRPKPTPVKSKEGNGMESEEKTEGIGRGSDVKGEEEEATTFDLQIDEDLIEKLKQLGILKTPR